MIVLFILVIELDEIREWNAYGFGKRVGFGIWVRVGFWYELIMTWSGACPLWFELFGIIDMHTQAIVGWMRHFCEVNVVIPVLEACLVLADHYRLAISCTTLFILCQWLVMVTITCYLYNTIFSFVIDGLGYQQRASLWCSVSAEDKISLNSNSVPFE